MGVESFLSQRKKTLQQDWFDLLVRSYPQEIQRTLAKESNQFANPVGHIFRTATVEILDEFLGGNDAEKQALLLDRIVRVRAVQDYPPSEALAFVFMLKKIARGLLEAELAEGRIAWGEVAEFEEKVDGLALLAFDVYMRCRENLAEIRVNEVKNRTSRLLQRAGITADVPSRKKPDEKQP